MYFAAADITVSPLMPFTCAMGIAFFCSMTGISGAFLLLPWQISFLNYTAPGVSATNQIFNIVACPAGVLRYYQERRLLMPLALIMIAGAIPGVFAGAIARLLWLNENKRFLLFASLMLFYLTFRLARSIRSKKISASGNMEIISFNFSRLHCKYQKQNYIISCPALFALSLAVGLAGGIYGVGGGAIMSPFLVSFFDLPVYIIAGASLLSTFVTSLFGVLAFAIFASAFSMPQASPDWALGLIMGLGGMAGMYLGAACQKHVSASLLSLALAIIVGITAVIYLFKAI